MRKKKLGSKVFLKDLEVGEYYTYSPFEISRPFLVVEKRDEEVFIIIPGSYSDPRKLYGARHRTFYYRPVTDLEKALF